MAINNETNLRRGSDLQPDETEAEILWFNLQKAHFHCIETEQ